MNPSEMTDQKLTQAVAEEVMGWVADKVHVHHRIKGTTLEDIWQQSKATIGDEIVKEII